jgi:hypothetical protein
LATAELALSRDKIKLAKQQAKEKVAKEKEEKTQESSPAKRELVEVVDAPAGAETATNLITPCKKMKTAKKMVPLSAKRPLTRQARALGLGSP